MIRVISCLTTIFLSFGCVASNASRPKGPFPKDTGSPEQDAKFYLSRFDRSLRGVMGYSLSVPGVDPLDPGLFKDVDVIVIPGTSDSKRGPSDTYNQDMTKYALRYNLVVLRYMGCEPPKHLSDCHTR
jgi:hypothetical protein